MDVTDVPAAVPADLDLERVWSAIVDEVEGLLSTTWATVLAPERDPHVLRSQFGRHCRVEGMERGRARVRVGASTPLDIARYLAGRGAAVEVVEPEPVRTEPARLGAEIVARYGTVADE